MTPKDVRKVLQSIEEEINSRMEFNVKEMLSSPSAYVRARGIRLAAEREIFIDNLETFLEDPSPEVRRSVVVSMGKFGIGLDKIVQALEDPSDIVRSTVVKELVEFGYKDSDLSKRVACDPSKKVRKTFVLALLETDEMESLKEFYNDPSNDIQVILAAHRGELELDEASLSALSKKLQKMAFAAKLTRRNDESLTELLKQLSNYQSALIRESIIELIGTFPEEIAAGQLKKLVESTDKYISLPALKAYRKLKGYDTELIPIAERLMDSEDEECRYHGVQYLKGLGEPSVAESLRQGLDDPSDRVRALAIEGLANLLDYSLDAVVEDSLKSTSSRLKKAALRAVKKLKFNGFDDLISRLLSNKKEENPTRILAASTVGALKLESLSVELERVIGDLTNNGRLRLAASRALARINPSRLGEIFGFTV